jgi:NitT/TauT family transport system substrate-binding protein
MPTISTKLLNMSRLIALLEDLRMPMTIARLLAVGVLMLAACSGPATAGDPAGNDGLTLRLGYLPNVTHATAIVGVERGIFAEKLGSGVTLEPHTFNAGPDVVEAIFSGALDASYIGPNPAINAFVRSNGEAIRIISGATSGGASLVVGDDIGTAQDLAGKTLASPQLGNTQDVALRAWLKEQGYTTDLEGGGEVSVVPQDNGDILTAFAAGELDGAWVPEPWATRMVEEAGGHVLVDERDLWADGQFVTTHLIVATSFLNAHPDVVKALLEGQVAANDFLADEPKQAQQVVGDAIAKLTGSTLDPKVLTRAWKNLEFTNDPIASSLTASAAHAQELGLLESADVDGIYDLGPLNQVLKAAGKPEVTEP